MAYIGIKDRRVGKVIILDADSQIRIGLRFGASAVTLSKAIQSLLDEGQDQILLNLEGVVSIDARGLADVVSAGAAVNQKGGRFKLLSLNECVRQVMTQAELLNLFEVFDVESQAIDSFTLGVYPAGNKSEIAPQQ
jgi:anti-anti-sigma factor